MVDYYKHELERTRQNAREADLKLKTISKTLNQQYPKAAETVDTILGIKTAHIPTIYVITPTHTRPVQKAELTRLGQTFHHVRNLHWIVVEDAESQTLLVKNFLADCGMRYTQLNIKTTDEYKLKENEPSWRKPRGVEQRNIAIDWILQNVPKDEEGVLYFADDDNTYSLKLFEEVQNVCFISVWPSSVPHNWWQQLNLKHSKLFFARKYMFFQDN